MSGMSRGVDRRCASTFGFQRSRLAEMAVCYGAFAVACGSATQTPAAATDAAATGIDSTSDGAAAASDNAAAPSDGATPEGGDDSAAGDATRRADGRGGAGC